VPYCQKLLDALRLDPATRLPGASLAKVRTHFREHYACITELKLHEAGCQEDFDEDKIGPKFNRCLVIDDQVLQSIESGPEPAVPGLPDSVKSCDRAYDAYEVFVKLLCKTYTTMERPHMLNGKGRMGLGGTEWEGWLKFSPVDFVRVYDELQSGNIEPYYKGPDTILRFQ
jgi:hypothetical protein